MNQQRSQNWFDQRKGRFTASEIHRLLSVQGLGQTGLGYAFEKATEIVFGRNEDTIETVDMRRGIELESRAFAKFSYLVALDFVDVKESFFFPWGDNAGASPDGLVGRDECLEIKCPKPLKLFNLIKDGEKAIDPEYIDQMQMQMMCTNSKRCNFFNFIIYNGVEIWHNIIVDRDESRISLIKQRIEQATYHRDIFVNKLIERKQFDLNSEVDLI